MPLPPNVSAELQRDMARLGIVVSQIRAIEEARQKRLEQSDQNAASERPHRKDRTKSGSQRPRRWRETDSNPRSPPGKSPHSETTFKIRGLF
jgi:hypothetical protein